MKVDAIRRGFYSVKNSLKKASNNKPRRIYNHDEIIQMPRTQVWAEIKSIVESVTDKFANKF